MMSLPHTSPVSTEAEILMNRPIMPGGMLLRLLIPASPPFPPPLAGQFVHLRAEGFPLLRRPFSVLGFSTASDGGAKLEIMYAIVGRGTEKLAELTTGDRLGVLGPLGNGYELNGSGPLVLVAGGRGAVPLFRLLEEGAGRKRETVFLFGARSREYLWELDRLTGVEHHLATDDGSAGRHGTVIDLLEEELARRPRGRAAAAPRVFACGPEVMLRRVAETAAAFDVEAQVALESPMGCAIGICRGCIIPRRVTAAGHWPRDGNPRYGTVCKEGPVFLGDEVDWEALEHAVHPAGATGS